MVSLPVLQLCKSHPSRVRGLKFSFRPFFVTSYTRVAPFTGAWIEITFVKKFANSPLFVAPFTGAWIEMVIKSDCIAHAAVAPFTGAWIEIACRSRLMSLFIKSHPSRVRGLK